MGDFVTAVLHRASLGWWRPDVAGPTAEPLDMRQLLGDLHAAAVVVHTPDGFAVAPGGSAQLGGSEPDGDCYPIAAYLPPLPPESLGDTAFCKDRKSVV